MLLEFYSYEPFYEVGALCNKSPLSGVIGYRLLSRLVLSACRPVSIRSRGPGPEGPSTAQALCEGCRIAPHRVVLPRRLEGKLGGAGLVLLRCLCCEALKIMGAQKQSIPSI